MDTKSTLGSVYERLCALREKLPGHRQITVNELMAQAISYVWGWQDAGGDERDTAYSIDFGHAYGVHAAEFEAEIRHSRMPIQDAFKLWRAGKRDPSEWSR